ncbi:hypothetical protein [Mesorhizobium silamurunense]|uniref:hypothetical protein n=1 Tax=Mesorhizobium silamurunense TaxID=499528 RepID=UPI001FEC48EA|nr:hypothetical protein [Mesorhizobium silamurunense]
MLRRQAGFAGERGVELAAHGIAIGFRVEPVKAHQCLALFDRISFPDQDFPDDAALQVLDGLAVAVHLHHTRRDRRAGQRRCRRPKAEAAEQQTDDGQATEHVGPHRRPGGRWGRHFQ